MKRSCIIGGLGLILSVTAGADQIEPMVVVSADTFLMGEGAASRDDLSRTQVETLFLPGLLQATNHRPFNA